MNGGVRIRPMTTADVGAVTELADSLPSAPHWPRSTYEAAVDPAARPERIALLAEGAGEGIAGFAVTSIAGEEAELESIAVAPGRQRQGVARALFARLQSQLAGRGMQAIFLEVRASNHSARSLYSALGFIEAGRRRAYYADPPEDALVLRLALAPVHSEGSSRG